MQWSLIAWIAVACESFLRFFYCSPNIADLLLIRFMSKPFQYIQAQHTIHITHNPFYLFFFFSLLLYFESVLELEYQTTIHTIKTRAGTNWLIHIIPIILFVCSQAQYRALYDFGWFFSFDFILLANKFNKSSLRFF